MYITLYLWYTNSMIVLCITQYLTHVFLGCKHKFKVHDPLGELLKEAAIGVDVHRLCGREEEVSSHRRAS